MSLESSAISGVHRCCMWLTTEENLLISRLIDPIICLQVFNFGNNSKFVFHCWTSVIKSQFLRSLTLWGIHLSLASSLIILWKLRGMRCTLADRELQWLGEMKDTKNLIPFSSILQLTEAVVLVKSFSNKNHGILVPGVGFSTLFVSQSVGCLSLMEQW